MPHATLPSPGLQALILCGPGVSLNTFTSNPSDFPKCLIPIANRPMVWYPLDWCHRMGVSDITLITPPESAPPLEAALATNPALTSLPGPKPEVLAPEGLTQTTGTGELLRLEQVQRAITGDFVVLPCDLISELEATKLLQQWLTLNPLSTSSATGGKLKGGLAMFYPTYGLENISMKKDETDFLATVHLASPPVPPLSGSLRPNVEEIVIAMPTDTLNDKLEDDKGFLRLRQSLMERHSRVKMRMRHRDSGVYVFPQWVKEFAGKMDGFDSISEDLVGWWAKAGWQAGLAEKLGLREILESDGRSGGANGTVDDEEEGEKIDVAALSSTKTTPLTQQPRAPAFASRVSDAPMTPNKPVVIPPILAYVQPAPSSPLIRRVDTSAQLLSVSLYLAKQPVENVLSHEYKVHPSATLQQQSRVSEADCLIGENVKLGFRSNIKESVIGANCEIGRNVRLTRCLLMEGVEVGDGVTMTGCIIGRRARVEGLRSPENVEGKGKGKLNDEGTRLTDCEVAPNFVVEAGMEAKGEKMMGFDTEGDEDLEEGEAEEVGEGEWED